jgi:hypothetical protein
LVAALAPPKASEAAAAKAIRRATAIGRAEWRPSDETGVAPRESLVPNMLKP